MGDPQPQVEERLGLTAAVNDLIFDVAETTRGEDEFSWRDEVTLIDSAENIDDLWVMEGAAQRLIAAGQEVLEQIRTQMSSDVDELGTIMLGDMLYRVGPESKRIIIDPDGLFDYLGDDWRPAFNPNSVRITAVRAIAERRGDDVKAIEDTFFDYDHDDDKPPKLTRLPRDKAPLYAQQMRHGDRRG